MISSKPPSHQSNSEQNMPVQGKKEEGRIRKRERKGKKEGREERNTHKYLMLFQINTRKKPHWMRNNPTEFFFFFASDD